MGGFGEGGGGWGVKRTRCSWVRSIDYVKVADSAVLGVDGRIWVEVIK